MQIVKKENLVPLKVGRSSGKLLRKLEELQVGEALVIPPEDQSMTFESLRCYVSARQTRLKMTLRVIRDGDNFEVCRYK